MHINDRTLRCLRAAVEAPPDLPVETAAIEGLSVLVVDDHPEVRNYVQALLHHGGAKVRSAKSVQQALHAMAEQTADVVVPVLAMTALTGQEERVLAGGFAGIVRSRSTRRSFCGPSQTRRRDGPTRHGPSSALSGTFSPRHGEKALEKEPLAPPAGRGWPKAG
jgi:CheY-like chemotaxis protein